MNELEHKEKKAENIIDKIKSSFSGNLEVELMFRLFLQLSYNYFGH